MPDFTHRSSAIEIMDDLQYDGEVLYRSLRELETINLLLGGNHVTIDGVRKLLKPIDATRTIAITDLGCGSGDILKIIRRWAVKHGRQVLLTGIDANPHTAEFARENTFGEPLIQYEAVDIFSTTFAQQQTDIITATLFFHHFTSDDLAMFFRQIKDQARIGIVINDIHRHWFAYYSIKWLTALFSRSTMVKNDAPLSVLRAFSKKELIDILRRAGITSYTIRWMWAFRWQVVIHTSNMI